MQQAREGKKQLKFGKPSPVNFNLVVVGETGAGKTTFLKTLFKSYCDDEIINSELSQDAFITVKIESLDAFTMDTPSLDVNVHLYDFPGYGDCINNLNAIKTIKEYIENAHRSWFETSSGLMTEKERNAGDKRIHCILYFIAPHRVREIDKEFFKQITGLAPIVPIIGKADTMKTSERRLHLLAVHAVLQEISRTRGDASVAFDFHEEGDYFLDTLPNRSTQSAVAEAAAPSPATRTPSINTNMNGLSETSDLSAQEEDEPCAVSITSHINCSAGSKKEHETSGSSQREQKQESSHDEVKSSAAAASVEGNFHLPSTASVASQQSSLHTSPSQVPHTALPRVRNLFAVVCDTSASGKREYPWGALDIYDEERSDTRRLQRLLFESDNITSMRATVQEMSVCMFQREKEAREQALANEAAAEHATAALEKRWRGVWGISPYVEYTVHVVIQALLGLTRLLLVALLLILVSLLLRMHA